MINPATISVRLSLGLRWLGGDTIASRFEYPPPLGPRRLLQCEPELRDERGAAPARRETLRISHRVDAAAGRRVLMLEAADADLVSPSA
jgi:hypothetical protein